MSKIKCSLTVSEGLHLCNQLIQGTPIQDKLIKYKIERNIYFETLDDLGQIGRSYWLKFLARHKDYIRRKTPKKFSLDRSSWTTYMNFDDMYRHVEEVMIKSKIARRLETSVWMDEANNVLESEDNSIGCKVEVDLFRPEMALVLDKVGCNTSQECNNAVGGELFLSGKNLHPYRTVSTRHNHFTVLGVTALSGEPVLCVVIISEKK